MKRLIVSILFLALAAATAQAGPNRAGASNGQGGGADRVAGIHDNSGAQAGQYDPLRDRTADRQRIHTPGTGDPATQTREHRGQGSGGNGNAGAAGTGQGPDGSAGNGNGAGKGKRAGKPGTG
jgi:hypothetical protein